MTKIFAISFILLSSGLSFAGSDKVNSRDSNMGGKTENCPYRAQMDLFSSTNPDSKVLNKQVSQNGTDSSAGVVKKKK